MELLGLGGAVLDFIKEKVFDFDFLWQFVGYHNRIDENRETLKRKLELLCSKEDDINKTLQVSEFHPGKKRKREVETWLRSVETKKNDVFKIQEQIEERKYSLGPWWESKLQKCIQQVEELYQKGNFERLLLDVHQSNVTELLTTTLVGQNLDDGGVLGRIKEWLMDDQTQRIGVYGVGGVGKTAIMMHIHNQLLKDSSFDNVYWLTVNDDDFSIHKLQNDIAKEVGLDFSNEVDKMKRAAKLHKGILRRKKCVMILDGVSSYFDLDDVGIPSQVNDCKLIITCRSMKLCRKMGCQKSIQIEPLSITESEKLFKLKMGVEDQFASSEVEEIAKEIVKECGGLPYKIIRLAETLRGVDDVSEWRYILNDL